jgi:cellulose 1,4-beta-cellobiosidase
MLRRHAGPLLVVVVLACAVSLASPASASLARQSTICRRRGYEAVASAQGGHYVVKNDNYGGRPECISNRGRRPNFTVTRSGANSYGSEVMAYPFVLYGCSWGLCTAGSRLPARVRRVRRATASWSTTARAAGRWNAAFDIWFGRRRSAFRGQARGAELMVWLDAHDYPAGRSRVIRVDHRRWYLYHWVTSNGGAHWNYIQIRAVRPTSHVRGLSLMPIIARVEKMGLIRRKWWLLNIESGFEIWHGGRGLATRSFAAAVRD